MEYRMKMLPPHYDAMSDCLISDSNAEQGCFALCDISTGVKRTTLLVREVIPLVSEDFMAQEELRLSVHPATMLRVARVAQKRALAVCMIHTHPMCTGPVEFSMADDDGNLRTFPFFHRMQPNLFHSCLVFDKSLEHVAGRVYNAASSWQPIVKVDVVGKPNCVLTTGHGAETLPEGISETYKRQALLLGDFGQAVIHKRTIGVIGQGGLGSSLSFQAVHSGFKSILGCDYDVVEEHNRPRIPFATVKDVDEKAHKVTVNKRYAEQYDPSIEFIALPTVVEDPGIVDRLKDCDLLAATTDDTRSRAFLNQFCQQHYIPLLDVGVEFVPNKEGEIVNEVGKVNFVLPGTPCLQCTGHIDSSRLRAEALPAELRDREINEGYIRGLDVEQPSMMMFNMEVAARGMQFVAAYFTGLFEINYFQYERFSFLGCGNRAHVKLVKKVGDCDCQFCLAGGEYFGAGDSLPMLITPTHQENKVEDFGI